MLGQSRSSVLRQQDCAGELRAHGAVDGGEVEIGHGPVGRGRSSRDDVIERSGGGQRRDDRVFVAEVEGHRPTPDLRGDRGGALRAAARHDRFAARARDRRRQLGCDAAGSEHEHALTIEECVVEAHADSLRHPSS